MIICYVIEEVDLVLRKEKSRCNGVDGSITPAFVEESTILIQRIEVVGVRLTAKPIKVSNFEI